MNKAMSGAVGLLLCLGGTPLVSANDSVAAFGAGGLVFTKTDAIAMEQEDLFISEDKIRVAYVFRNTSKQDINTRVAFPVPEFPAEPDMDIGLDVHSSNPMGFSVQVDGKKKAFDTEIKKKSGNVKMTHHWMQTFPAGKTLKVVHEYKPATGGEAMLWFQDEERKAKISKYCLEPDFVKWLDKTNQPDKGVVLSPRYVDYILTTGANWKGSIGKFRLTVQKEKAEDKISLCGTGLKKVDARTFVMEKADFTPEKDLAVMFVHQYTLVD
jgi:hypothetical protein